MESQPVGPSLRQRNRAATRAALISAAIRLGNQRGWDATSVSDIAAAAGASRRTFNNYFASKEDAIVRLGALRLAEVREFLESAAGDEPLWSAIRTAFREVFSAAEALDDEQRRAVAELVRATPAPQAAQIAADVAAEKELAAGIAARLEAGASGGLYPRLAAAVISRTVRVSYQYWLAKRLTTPFVDTLDHSLGQVALGLPPPAGS
jgi:AcrR family transcriptional regulator